MKPSVRTLAAVSLILLTVHRADGQLANRSDETSLARLLGEEILSQNGRAVVHAARMMGDDDAEKYEHLANWVLPGHNLSGTHNASLIRVEGYFTTTNPIPENGVANAGGEIEAPALELIRVAGRLNRLDDLFQRVNEIADADNENQRRKVAMLALIELARGRTDAAGEQAEAFYELVANSDVSLTDRWPSLLLLNHASESPTLHDVTKETLQVLQPVRNKLRETVHGFHLQAALARIEYRDSDILKHWHSSARATAGTRGAGHPNTRWHVENSTLRCVTSHHIDYAHYQIPLLGNYEVEAEVSMAPYENGVVFLGGNWLSVPGPSGMYRGDYRSAHGYSPFSDTKLPKPKTWSRYRSTVRGNQITTWMNGRELDRREFGYAPWLAIRNNPGKRGAVRNLQITGRSEIPEEVYPLLEGVRSWKAYENETEQRWSTNPSPTNGSIKGTRVGREHSESLIHYHRPIVEDGTVEYEFFYKPDEYSAHPAIERLAFVLSTDGIRLRWIDDGIHDHSSEFRSVSQQSNPVSESLFLKENDWNQLRLTFQGNHVQIAVNGVDAYQHKMVQRQRRLGLYYVASESSLEVRNMVWRGNWPRVLPTVDQQELAGNKPEYLDGVDQWSEHTRVDFKQPLDRTRFVTPRNNASDFPAIEGLRVEPDVVPGYSGHWIGDKERIHGDFDAMLRFSDLEGSAETGQADFALRFIDESGNRYVVARGFRPDGQQLAAIQWMTIGNDGKKTYGLSYTGDEAKEGSLRLVRRDDTIYALIAYGDSDRFHLLGSRKLLLSDSFMTLRIEASRKTTARISAVLEELVIRTKPTADSR